ncbi:MAG: hypothetical protein ABI467_07345 [Kofleriaceae bacterium]
MGVSRAGRALHGPRDDPSSLALLDARPDLLDHQHGLLARYYDVAAITSSPLARRVFVLQEPAR